MVGQWNRLPQQVVEAPYWSFSKEAWIAIVITNPASWQCIRLDDTCGPFQPYSSMKIRAVKGFSPIFPHDQ